MLTIKINDTPAQDALNRLADSLSDMTPAMQEIGEMLVASTQDRIAAGQQPDGTPFAPRSPVTLSRYAREGKSFGHPLNVTNTMRTGIYPESGPTSVRVGSPAIQAAVMQFGAAQGAFGASMGKDKRGRDHFHHIPWGDIPARPFLGLSEGDRAGIVETVEEWLERLSG